MRDDLEDGVMQILPLFKTYFLESAGKITSSKVRDIEFIETNTISNRGRGGTLLISDVTYHVILDEDTSFPMTSKIAIKFAQNLKSAIKEMKNSMLLENRYSSHPQYGTPRILYGSTNEPIILLYEGIDGINYDICAYENKAFYAGKLLAILHSTNFQPVDDLLYQNYVRKIVQYYAPTGREKEISMAMGEAFNKIKGLSSGAVIHSDFHQSNVMLSLSADGLEVLKVYVIDPEFMTSGHYDRMEDIGTFFGNQALIEFSKSGKITNTIQDIKLFLMGYNDFLANSPQKVTLNQVYPRGLPLDFFMGLWALLDALDFVMTRTEGNSMDHPEVDIRIQFALFCLKDQELDILASTKF